MYRLESGEERLARYKQYSKNRERGQTQAPAAVKSDEDTKEAGEGGFTRIGNEVFEAGLKPVELAVYAVLAYHCHEDNACFPSVATIAKLANISRSKVFDTLNVLEGKGAIERHYGGGGRLANGRGASAIYVLKLDARLRKRKDGCPDKVSASRRQQGVKP